MTAEAASQPRFGTIWRSVWYLVWLFFFLPSPRNLHGWRCFLLRLFGAKIGKRAHPYPRAWVWAPWNLVMAEDSCLGDGVDCYNVALVTLDAKASVSQRTFICAATHDYNDPAFPVIARPIRFEANAWVAAEAFIGPGVTVGEGAIVGARAVVFKDVPARAIVAGNPAKVIKMRPTANGTTVNPE